MCLLWVGGVDCMWGDDNNTTAVSEMYSMVGGLDVFRELQNNFPASRK